MGTIAIIVDSSPHRLWGVTSHDRIIRQLATTNVSNFADNVHDVNDHDDVLLINANYLFEVRTLTGLLRRSSVLLQCPDDAGIAAAHVTGAQARDLTGVVTNVSPADSIEIDIVRPGLSEDFDADLRKVDPPTLKLVTQNNIEELERLLYGNSYKGITDLVTKWLWPLPAKLLVTLCTKLGISPNAVTTAGLALVLAASFLFLNGHYAGGLACAWLMTLLDTVDGKLARVTIQSSRLGHVLDHGIDIVHPPFWYVMWGMGLISFTPLFECGRIEFFWIITVGYITGRIIEGFFHGLGNCSLFAWRPLDAYFRLVTARRNPCLIILTSAYAIGRPDWGLVGVGLWTATSSSLMLARLFYALVVRIRKGPLESWLKDPEVAKITHAAAYRTFSGTRGAYG